jgi:ribonuclease Z
MVNMKLIFLGTSAATPTMERGLSSIALVRGGELLIFDTGEGMQRNFIKARLGVNKKMKIFITHMHADHCLGLLGLLQTMSLQGREKAVDIYGPKKLSEFLKENMRIINFGLIFEINIHTIDNEGIVVREKDYQISCCNAEHLIPAYAYSLIEYDRPGIFNVQKAKLLGIPQGELYRKLQYGHDIIYNGTIIKSTNVVGPSRSGRKIGISGDTRPTNKLKNFFENCNLLVFESTYGDDNNQKAIEYCHSTAAEAAMLAKKSHVKKLLLTHFSARYDDTSSLINEASIIHQNVEAAHDLKTVNIPYSE